ncbi:hypothetical protein [Calidifontibacter terrae]
MLRRWVLITAFTVMACLTAGIVWSAAQSRPPLVPVGQQEGPTIVIGVSGLTLYDSPWSRTSALWSIARKSAIGAMSTRGLTEHSCSAQSWLTISAGVRTSLWPGVGMTPDGKTPGACPQPPLMETFDDGSALFPDWPTWRRTTLARSAPADIGKLSTELAPAGSGKCVQASGRYAAIGAADHNGVVSHYLPDPTSMDFAACDVSLISLDSPNDTLLRSLIDHAPPGATIIVAGIADDLGPEQLHPVVIYGQHTPHGLLTSESTRQRGIIQLADVSAMLFSRLGKSAPNLPEARLPQVQASGSPTAPLLRTAEIIQSLKHEHAAVTSFVIAFYLLIVAGLSAGWVLVLLARRLNNIRLRVAGHRLVSVVAATAVAMPVSTMLVNLLPWVRFGRPRLALAIGICAIALSLALISLVGPWRRWLGGSSAALMLITGSIIALDATHGTELQLLSIFGLQPVYGGRFYGMGNVAYAWFATAALMFAAIVANPLVRNDRGRHGLGALTVVMVGIAAVIVDGYPSWGADAGGPLALVPAFAYLAINTAGWRLTWVRLTLVVGGAAATVTGLAAIDYLRGPANRTHLGDFFGQVVKHGNFDRASRIWEANWTMLTGSWLTMLVPLLIVAMIYLQVRPSSRLAAPLQPVLDYLPILRNGLAAVTVCLLIAFFLNDSGTGIPPAGLMLLIPLTVMQRARIADISLPRKERSPQQ